MHEFSSNIAVVIGIDQYTNGITPLLTAVNDAKELASILSEKHGYKGGWLLLDQQATLSKLKELLEKTLPKLLKPDDRLFFYFAGHGIARDGEDGPAGYLVPQDAQPGNPNSFLPMHELHDALAALPCRHFLAILDCCFAGAFRWSSFRDLLTVPEVIHKERYDRFIKDPAWQAITSAGYNQTALDVLSVRDERDERGNTEQHSPFAEALFEALQGKADIYPHSENGKPSGDGIITATELYIYLRDRTQTKTGEHQTPGLWPLKKHDRGEYIFLVPDHVLNLPSAPPLDESKNPYRGLESFEEQHSELFFGRTALIEKLHGFVSNNSLTVVLGASGTGKSSLVKAGLIPHLKKEGFQHWQILTPFRPGESPFSTLNNVLVQEKLPVVDIPQPAEPELKTSVAAWSDRYPESKLLLVIDQCEELIILCRNDQERRQFLAMLNEVLTAYPHQLRIVLTLRSDFEPQFRDTALEPLWAKARFVVPAMTREELREAIEEPASARVMYFDPHSLVDQIIDEVAQMPGALPLLSFTLSELYLNPVLSL